MAPGTLKTDLATLFDAPDLDHALVSVMIREVETGAVVYEREATKLASPASIAKLATLAAAAEKLGWDHRYETRLVTSAPIANGVLKGDLIVIGSGDPSMNDHHGGARVALGQIADQLRAAGIVAIDGALVGDGRAFGSDTIGDGWAWDHLAEPFAAPVAALQVRENTVHLELRAGDTVGAPIVVAVPVSDGWLELDVRATTAPAGTTPTVRWRRLPGTVSIEIAGQAPLGFPKVKRGFAIARPIELFLRELSATLRERRITIRGGTSTGAPASGPEMKQLASYRSPPLSELATVMMKKSQNGYAETLLRTLGATTGDGTAAGGVKVVTAILGGWGIAPDSYVLRDGSGLSRFDYVTAAMMVDVLRHMHRDPRHRDAFLATFPIAGRDGTLADRMTGTPAEGNVRAKTGTLASVRSLAGFVDTKGGRRLAFAIIANGFRVPVTRVDEVVEAALVRLATSAER
ncbi:MAG TPA: D-alanyl-D-alanine carboxypeptidase/D-alanyl-D-alanine-endopeptidase [Kofleriaceae bacterium]